MDGQKFDTLIMAVSQATSRRGLMRLISGGVVAAALAGIQPALAKHKGKRKRHKKGRKHGQRTCSQLNQGCDAKQVCCQGFECNGGICSCPAGTVASGGSCVPQTLGCTSNAECAAGQICQAGSCVVITPECTINNDCGIDEICVDGNCVLIEAECQGDDDCDGNEQCVNGFCECLDSEDGRCVRRCESGLDCPGPSQCQNLAPEPSPFIEDGVCVDQPFLLCDVDRCTTNDDCQSDEVCVMQDCDGPDPVGVCYPFSVF